MSVTTLLMHDYAVDGLVSVSAGIINRDGMVPPKRMIINGGAVFIHEGNVSAVAKAPMVIANAKTDVVRTKFAPGAPEMVRERSHRQAHYNYGENKNEFFHIVRFVSWPHRACVR